ncbi:response regulator transcription factor [Ruegeria pomeroyi]|uniref:response regulator transcription factor n=1 Tax=Ruegeria pomeroyi TaxID=89184 RepID=UPI001F1D45E6|nr:response regulator transcription factor [Ruegeria pomeroyi]MCE8510969.1 response regulator transcription factor [Ruegeria pomeroyi]
MRVLIVEDEQRVADFIRRGLRSEGCLVEHACDGETALELLRASSFDVILLDLLLPGMSGIEVCRMLRARSDITPVLMLTALDTTEERIRGLNSGADDYLPKPFNFDELLARIQALYRRNSEFRSGRSSEVLEHKGLALNLRSLVFCVDGSEVELSTKERDLVLFLLRNMGVVLSRERILNAVWGSQSDPLTNIVDVYIGRVRKKFGRYGKCIATLRGAGYRLD